MAKDPTSRQSPTDIETSSQQQVDSRLTRPGNEKVAGRGRSPCQHTVEGTSVSPATRDLRRCSSEQRAERRRVTKSPIQRQGMQGSLSPEDHVSLPNPSAQQRNGRRPIMNNGDKTLRIEGRSYCANSLTALLWYPRPLEGHPWRIMWSGHTRCKADLRSAATNIP